MLRSLNSGVSGIQQFQTRLDVIGNNIANANTVGFKSSRTDFAEAFNQSMLASAPGAAGTAPVQVGTGVSTAAVRNLFGQGTINRTGKDDDLAISGEGFFIVRDPVSGEEFATRAGDFERDSQGYLVNHLGHRVQGFSDGALSTRGDLKIDDAGKPEDKSAATYHGFEVDSQGRIVVKLSDKSQFTRGQVLLQRFQNAEALVKEGSGLFSGLADAGPLGGTSPQAQPPGTSGLGEIQSGALELSNVDLANEFANLITTQRGFQASARIVTTSDEVLQEVVNLKR